MNTMPDDLVTKMNNLLIRLEPDLNDLRNLIRNMAQIESNFKSEFNYIRFIVNQEAALSEDIEKKALLLTQELNQFGALLEKIVEDDQARELYVNAGLLDKCLELKKNIQSKISI